VLGVDASKLGFGAVLQQEDERGSRHPSRYESGLWTAAETRYDAVKLECRGLLRPLKEFRHYVYGVHFLVEIDAKTLVHQLNQPMTDLPGAVVGRWIAYIRMYSFDIQHVSGARHKGPDALSRRPPSERELWEHERDRERKSEELEREIDGALGCVVAEQGRIDEGEGDRCAGFCTSVFHSFSLSSLSFLDGGVPSLPTGHSVVSFVSFQRGLYEEEPGLVKVGEFLSALRRPAAVGEAEFKGFK
jgi:hypothetical protein